MARTKKTINTGKILLIVLLSALLLGGIIFGYWYVSTGWNGENAIFQAFKQIEEEEGWFRWAVVKGGLHWAVSGMAFYFLAAPILLIVNVLIHKGVSKLYDSFTFVFQGAIIFFLLASLPGIFFNTMVYFREELAILALIFGGLGLLSLIPAGEGVIVIVSYTAKGRFPDFFEK